jgi:hypothetical protein
MMRKILILSLAFSTQVFALERNEEAIILNQELKFLEDSVTVTDAMSLNTLDTDGARNRAINDESLERTYFNDFEEDTVSTKTAGPKRRSY